MIDFLLILLISIGVSTLGTIAGFGGAVFLVPILMLFFGYPMEMAIGSVIIALFPSSLLSTLLSLKNKIRIDGRRADSRRCLRALRGKSVSPFLPVLPVKKIGRGYAWTDPKNSGP